MPETPKRAPVGREPGPKSPSAVPQPVAERFLGAFRDYVKALEDVAATSQQRCREAQSEFMKSFYAAQLETQKSQEDAYRTYANSMRDAAGRENARGLALEAEQKCARDLEAGQTGARRVLDEAARTASGAMKEAYEKAERSCEQARIAYVKALQDGLARLDPQSVRAEDMAFIGQSFLAAAQYARMTPHN